MKVSPSGSKGKAVRLYPEAQEKLFNYAVRKYGKQMAERMAFSTAIMELFDELESQKRYFTS